MRTSRILSSLAPVLVLCASDWAGEPRILTEFAKITASDGIEGDGFGFSLAADGDFLVVGAPGYFTQAGSVGAVYVYRRSGPNWIQVDLLFAEEGVQYDFFGSSVAIEGDLILIGAPFQIPATIGGGYGSAYLFRRHDFGTPNDLSDDRWFQDAKFTSPDEIRFGDSFGRSVSISNSVLLIGRPGWDFSSGSAYLYRELNGVWRYWSALDPSDSIEDDAFGSAVSLSGSVALVGAWRRNDAGIHSGAAYVFRESQGVWSEVQKLVPSDAGDFGSFGKALDFSEGLAVIGASGRAYTHTEESDFWSEDVILNPGWVALL